MPHQLQPVRPGDLITAQTWNDLLLKIEEIEERLDELEGNSGGTGLAITGRIPATGPYRIADTLVLLGGNFQFSLGATQVFLNAVRVLNLTGSTDTRLTFVIPPVPGVVEPGTEVTLRVLNQTAEVTQQIVLRPALPVVFGEVDVVWLSANPTTPQSGDPATFAYRITSRASAAADFVIAPLVGVAVGQPLWQSRLQVLDSNLSPIPGNAIRLNPLEQRQFNVRIAPIPGDTQGVAFTLTVNATAGAVHGTSGAQPFTVGQPAETPDTTITLNPTQSFPQGTELSGDTVFVFVGTQVRVRFTAEFEVSGIYDLTVTTPPEDGWDVTRFALTTPAFYELPVSPGQPAVRFPEINIGTGGGSMQSTATVRLQRRGAANSRAFTLNLFKDNG